MKIYLYKVSSLFLFFSPHNVIKVHSNAERLQGRCRDCFASCLLIIFFSPFPKLYCTNRKIQVGLILGPASGLDSDCSKSTEFRIRGKICLSPSAQDLLLQLGSGTLFDSCENSCENITLILPQDKSKDDFSSLSSPFAIMRLAKLKRMC